MGDSIFLWVSSKIKKYDIFGKTIIPTYNTKLGGATSLIILVCMSYTAIVFIHSVLNYSDIKFNKNEKKVTLAQDLENHEFVSGDGVKFAIAWINQNQMKLIDKSYGEIFISQEYYYKCPDAPENSCFETTEVPLESCSVTEFTQGI